MNESPSMAPDPDAGSIRALLAEHESVLDSILLASLRAPRVSRMRAIQQTSDLLGAFAVVDSHLGSIYSDAFIERLRETVGLLPLHRDLFVAADLALELPWSPETKVQRDELTKNVRGYDATLTRWVGAAIDEVGTDEERAAAKLIRRGTGHQDDAEDTIRWVDSGLGRAEIRALLPDKLVASMPGMRADARTLLVLLGVDSEGTEGPAVVRRRAYTLFANAFDLLAANGAHAAQQLGIDATFERLWAGPAATSDEPADAPPATPDPVEDPAVN